MFLGDVACLQYAGKSCTLQQNIPRDGTAYAQDKVAECLHKLECRVVNRRLVNDYNSFVLQGVKAMYGYPKDEAAKIAVAAIRIFLAAYQQIEEVRLVCFSEGSEIS